MPGTTEGRVIYSALDVLVRSTRVARRAGDGFIAEFRERGPQIVTASISPEPPATDATRATTTAYQQRQQQQKVRLQDSQGLGDERQR